MGSEMCIRDSYTAGSRNRFEGMEPVCIRTQKQKTLSKTCFFFVEKYIEDARQNEKHVPELLESIIQPPGLVKEELRQNLFKMSQFRSEITKIRPEITKIWV